MSKYVCNPNDFAGNFIKEVEPIIVKYNSKAVKRGFRIKEERRVELKCLHCGKHFIATLANAKRTKQKCCSGACSRAINFHFGIPNEKHPLYSRWLDMYQRCFNHNAENFKNYGGRGITLAPEFRDFIVFAEYVLSLPNCPKIINRNTQIDRINNDGNYEKGNLRWADTHTQSVNKRSYKRTSTCSFIGVSYNKNNNRYYSKITTAKGGVYLGCFKTEYEAAKVREDYIKANNLPNKLNGI